MLAPDPAKFIAALEASVNNEYQLTQWSLAIASSVVPGDASTLAMDWYKSLDAAIKELNQIGTAWATGTGPVTFAAFSETAAAYNNAFTHVIANVTEDAAQSEATTATMLRELLPTLLERAEAACTKVKAARQASDALVTQAKAIKAKIAAALKAAQVLQAPASQRIDALKAELQAAQVQRVVAETLLAERNITFPNFLKLVWPATGAPITGAAAGWWTGRLMYRAGEIGATVKGQMLARGAQGGAAIGIGIAALGLMYLTYKINDARSTISQAVTTALKKIEELSVAEQGLFILETMIESMTGLIESFENLPAVAGELQSLWEAEHDRLAHAIAYLRTPTATLSAYPDLGLAALHSASAAWTRISNTAIELQKLRGVMEREVITEVAVRPTLTVAP